MQGKKKEKSLFKEVEWTGFSRTLILNKPRILEIIEAVSRKQTLPSLRQAVFELKDRLSNSRNDKEGLFNIGTNGDTLKVNHKYLVSELKQIAEAQSFERAGYYLRRLAKAVSEQRTNKINDLNLNQWKQYDDIITDSLWLLGKRDSSGVHSSGYWGNFVPQIPQQMMKRYTKKGEWILDTFAGCGTTLIEAQRLGRNSIGTEIQQNIVRTANELINCERNRFNTTNEVIQGNSTEIDYKGLLARYGRKSIQLLIMHPPYFDIIKFSKDPKDLSNAKSVEDFLEKMNKVIAGAARVLDKGRYFALVIGDKYSKGEWIPLGFLTMQEVLKNGFTLKSIIIKNFDQTLGKRNQKELWRYRALVGGFYIFKHEYIFLFKKK